MNILIVDDNAENKCWEIIEQCQERNINIDITGAIGPTCNFLQYAKRHINGIILDMGLPLYEGEIQIYDNGGDRILRFLRNEECTIPVLIFSVTESKEKEKCDFVFDQINRWGIVEEENKFYAFLKKLEEQS